MWRRGEGRIDDSWGLHALGQDRLYVIAGNHQARSGVESNEKLVATKSNPSDQRKKFPENLQSMALTLPAEYRSSTNSYSNPLLRPGAEHATTRG